MIKIINGDSIKELKNFPDNYFYSVVTDPPYGLSFMGKKWDYDVPSVELWKEVFRVLKEGGYLLSFAGTRTQHRMAVNIEDAGFEIRDMIAWVYGSGFPKSHNIGKAVDKLQGNEREEFINKTGKGSDSGSETYNMNNGKSTMKKEFIDSKGTSEWEGWGTALKPALEPITMARKPFKGTVANNVLKNGVGGINIDGCRVGVDENDYKGKGGGGICDKQNNKHINNTILGKGYIRNKVDNTKGRFPANFIHDGSDEVTDLFPYTKTGKPTLGKKDNTKNAYGKYNERSIVGGGDEGSASRFFYCAKASKQDRNEGCENLEEKKYSYDGRDKEIENAYQRNKSISNNNHPTVKPTDLMRYLIRLVTPKDGIVLDCFMGSGSTGKACALEGFNFVGIDLDKDYCEIAKARIDKAIEDKRIMDSQTKLF